MTMTVAERINDREAAFRSMLDGRQAEMQTGMVGIIRAINADGTVRVQPAIQARISGPNGGEEWVDLPELPDVPLFFPSGGGMIMTFPVAVGDECWVAFSSRCLDAWFQAGGTQPQLDPRMHNLSDAVAFVGIRSQPNAVSRHGTNAEIRSVDGSMRASFGPGGTITFTCTTFNVISTNFQHNGVNVGQTHVHTGVQSGGSNSGPPQP